MPRQRREWKVYNDDVERTFTQHQTQITQFDSSISLQASTITSLDGKVENYYSELTVADTGIRTEVATKVGASTIISTINQSAESVTIDASKINLNGFVTFTNLAAYGDHTIALGDGSNTLTIDGSTITGTNLSGWIGYKLRPSSLDIYSFTSNNDLVGRLSATKSTQMGSSDVGVALFADSGDWLTVGRLSGSTVAAALWSDPSNNNTYLAHVGDSYADVSLNSGALYFGNSNNRKNVWVDGAQVVVAGNTSNFFGKSGVSTTINGSTISLAGTSVTAYSNSVAVLDFTSSGSWVGNDALPMTLTGSTTYINSEGAMTLHADGNIDVRGGDGKFGMYVYSGGTLTGLMFANDANADSTKHCYMDLAYNGNVYISGVHLYFNGTQIA